MSDADESVGLSSSASSVTLVTFCVVDAAMVWSEVSFTASASKYT